MVIDRMSNNFFENFSFTAEILKKPLVKRRRKNDIRKFEIN